MKKVALLAATGALAFAVPATAKHTPGTHPSHSHKCATHRVGFVASGTLGTWSLTLDPNGKTYSGTITVNVAHGNHHAKGYKGLATTFPVSGVHVVLAKGMTAPPAAGSRIQLIGKETAVAKKCATGFTPTITIRKIIVKPATGNQ